MTPYRFIAAAFTELADDGTDWNLYGAIDWWYRGWEGSCEENDERPDAVINAEHLARAIGLVDDIRMNRGITDPNVTVHP